MTESEKVFITGAAALLGSHIVERLVAQGFEVTALVKDHHDTSFLESIGGVKIVKGELKKPSTFSNHIPKNSIVIHNYSLSPGANATKEVYYKENVLGTANLLNSSKSNNIKQFVYISSCSVVGPRAKKRKFISESSEERPDTNYGWSKLAAEKAVKLFYKRTKIPCLILRVFPIYGPRAHINSTPIRLYKMLRKKRFVIVGKGKNLYEFNYAGNTADSILLASQKKKKGIHTFNVSEPSKRTYKEVLMEIAQYANPQVKYIHFPKLLAYPIAIVGELVAVSLRKRFILRLRTLKGLIGAWNSDCTKIEKELGYKQKYSLEQGVSSMVKWINDNKIIEKEWVKK